MATCWKLNIGDGFSQVESQKSFIGGKPVIPENIDVPKCKLCGEEQSFIFQVEFPEKHCWSGLSLALFFCVACADENHLIPEMLEGPLHGVNIPKDFLVDYQKNFKFIVYKTDTGFLKTDYVEKVSYKPIDLEFITDSNFSGSKIGGSPAWLLEDESPGQYDGSYSMNFLLQIEQDMRFDIVDNAPHQVEIGLMGDSEPSPNSYYQLFNGNKIYLFGVSDCDVPLVYAITQI